MKELLRLLGQSGQLLFALVILVLYVSIVLPWGVAAGTTETLGAIVGLWLIVCALFVWIRLSIVERIEAAQRNT